jgi:GNAT superfamily N-acetyltransferase
MVYKKLGTDDVDTMVEIFHQDSLKYATGEYPEAGWLKEFVLHGYARGIVVEDKIKAALIAEPILAGGVYLWVIAARADEVGKGYGAQLYYLFEEEMRGLEKSWIFLTSGQRPEAFYRRNGFISQDVPVKEMFKSLE